MPSKKEVGEFSLWGIVIFGGGVVAVVWAQQYLPSSLASIIITTPFWFIVLDRSQWHINFKSGWIITGLVAGLAGVILLLTQRPSSKPGVVSFTQLKAMFVIIAGSLLWVVGSLRMRNRQSQVSVYAKTAIHLLAASGFAFVVSFVTNEHKTFQWNNIHTDAVVALLCLSLLSTTATFLAFIWLLQKKTVAVVSTYSYINPVVAVLLGVFIGGESVNSIQVIAMLIILSGVLFVSIPKYKLKP
jgi:drug/metabolite transporter (DMT)-like permease